MTKMPSHCENQRRIIENLVLVEGMLVMVVSKRVMTSAIHDLTIKTRIEEAEVVTEAEAEAEIEIGIEAEAEIKTEVEAGSETEAVLEAVLKVEAEAEKTPLKTK